MIPTVLSGEQRSALEHLCEDTSCAPDIYSYVVLLPCEHDLGSTIVSGGHVSRHLWVLNSGQTEVTDFEIAIFVDQNVGRLEVSVNDARTVDVFKTSEDLVQEILDKLLFERPRCEETVEVCSEELRHKVNVFQG